jgi:hypothetical protein
VTWKLNRKGYDHAKGLIQAGKVNDGKWEKPNLEDFKDIEEYALFHLGKDPEADPNTAEAYAYTYGRGGEVYIQALRAIRSAAAGARGATRNEEIFNAAGGLLEMIDEKTEKCQGQCIQQNMIIKVDKHQRIVTGPVLVPDEYDLDGDILTKDQIEEVAYNFMENYQNIDILHRFKNVAKPVESFILREDTVIGDVELPEGTWILSAKVYDDDTWKGIVQGKYQGFSITAIPAAMKKTTLEDIGWPFEVVTVSIVDRPAVPKAKYLSIKGGGDKMDEKSVLKSIFDSLKQYFENDKTVEEVVDAGEVQALKAEIDSLRNSIKEVMDELKSIKDELKSIKSTQTEPSGEPETSEEAIEEPETSEETIDEPKVEDAQAIKGQVGAVKGAHTLYEEMGVDRFGRPL